jgi:hypothetical protein
VRFLTKFSLLAAALLAVALLSTSVRANDLLTGGFTLSQATQWNNTLLPAGEYRIRLMRTAGDSDLLVVRGQKQTMSVLVHAPSLCRTCGEGSLNLVPQGDNLIVSSMDLAGVHVNFDVHKSAAELEREMAKLQKQSQKPAQQIAVHVDPNN